MQIDKLKKSVKLAALSFVGLILAGCVGDHGQYSTFVPGLKLVPDTRAVVQSIQNDTPKPQNAKKPSEINPNEELVIALERELEKSGLKGQLNTPDVIVLIPSVADYEGGNAFVRAMAGGGSATGAGRTLLLVRCKLQRNGAEIGTINVRRTVEFDYYGSSVGQWKTIFQTAAADIIKELKMGIRSNQ